MSAQEIKPSPQVLRSTAFGSAPGFLAFGFGAGLVPLAPGTAGTVVAVPFAVALKLLDPLWFWAALVPMFALGVWCCGRAGVRSTRSSSPGCGGCLYPTSACHHFVSCFFFAQTML